MKHIKFISTVGMAAIFAALMMLSGCKKSEIVASGITISSEAETISIGSTVQLSYTVEPTGAKVESAVWSSSDPAVATVDQSGLVTAIDVGNATIIITVNGTFAEACAVRVQQE